MHDTRDDRYDLPVDPGPLRGARRSPALVGQRRDLSDHEKSLRRMRYLMRVTQPYITDWDPVGTTTDEPDRIPF